MAEPIGRMLRISLSDQDLLVMDSTVNGSWAADGLVLPCQPSWRLLRVNSAGREDTQESGLCHGSPGHEVHFKKLFFTK